MSRLLKYVMMIEDGEVSVCDNCWVGILENQAVWRTTCSLCKDSVAAKYTKKKIQDVLSERDYYFFEMLVSHMGVLGFAKAFRSFWPSGLLVRKNSNGSSTRYLQQGALSKEDKTFLESFADSFLPRNVIEKYISYIKRNLAKDFFWKTKPKR